MSDAANLEPLVDFQCKLSPEWVRLSSHDARLKLLEAQPRGNGALGEAGPAGPRGEVGPMPEHEWSDTSLRFQQGPDGAWGEWVDLRGPAGATRWIPSPPSGGGGPAVVNQYMPGGW